jgi:hypothetical protein
MHSGKKTINDSAIAQLLASLGNFVILSEEEGEGENILPTRLPGR